MKGPPVRRVVQASLAIGLWLALFILCLHRVWHGHWPWAFGAVGLAALAAWALDAFVPALSPFAIRRGQRAFLGKPRVALTFDDGPSEDTPAVLQALAESGVRATFFMLGRHVEQHPELARAVVAGGHAVGNHTYSHRILSFRSVKAVMDEIDRANTILESIGATSVKLFRAPRGFQGPQVRRALRDRGMRLIGWTRGAWDSEPRSPLRIAAAATENPRDGDILLLHDGAGTPGWQRRQATAEAIPDIVRTYRARGFRFVTVPELLTDGRTPA